MYTCLNRYYSCTRMRGFKKNLADGCEEAWVDCYAWVNSFQRWKRAGSRMKPTQPNKVLRLIRQERSENETHAGSKPTIPKVCSDGQDTKQLVYILAHVQSEVNNYNFWMACREGGIVAVVDSSPPPRGRRCRRQVQPSPGIRLQPLPRVRFAR